MHALLPGACLPGACLSGACLPDACLPDACLSGVCLPDAYLSDVCYAHWGMLEQTGATPLFIAAQGGHVEVVRALLGAGANVEAATTVGGTHVTVVHDGVGVLAE